MKAVRSSKRKPKKMYAVVEYYDYEGPGYITLYASKNAAVKGGGNPPMEIEVGVRTSFYGV